jgi:hypothetical protein
MVFISNHLISVDIIYLSFNVISVIFRLSFDSLALNLHLFLFFFDVDIELVFEIIKISVLLHVQIVPFLEFALQPLKIIK